MALVELRNQYPDALSDLVKKYAYLQKEVDGTLLTEVLDINKDRFYKYVNAIISFWEEFPERSFLKNSEF